MATTSETYGLKYETYGKGYKRRCPICNNSYSSGKMAIQCWYLHPAELGGQETLANRPVNDIADIMGLSTDTVRRAWRYLVDTWEAPERFTSTREVGNTYTLVVRFLRKQRQNKHGLRRGWTQHLAKELGITRQRVSQHRQRALLQGDLVTKQPS